MVKRMLPGAVAATKSTALKPSAKRFALSAAPKSCSKPAAVAADSPQVRVTSKTQRPIATVAMQPIEVWVELGEQMTTWRSKTGPTMAESYRGTTRRLFDGSVCLPFFYALNWRARCLKFSAAVGHMSFPLTT
jgi:hypothetical protein